MHALMRRQGWDVGRDQTERLIRLAGVRGVRKSRRVFTTRSDEMTVPPSDLVNVGSSRRHREGSDSAT